MSLILPVHCQPQRHCQGDVSTHSPSINFFPPLRFLYLAAATRALKNSLDFFFSCVMAEILRDAFNYRLWAVLSTMWHCCTLTTDAWKNQKGSLALNPQEIRRTDKEGGGGDNMLFSPVTEERRAETWRKRQKNKTDPADTPRTPQWQLMLKDEKQLVCGWLPRCTKVTSYSLRFNCSQ